MHLNFPPADGADRDKNAAGDAAALLALAQALKRAARAGAVQPSLKGKNLGLLAETVLDGDELLFRNAAAELGANVALIRPSLTEFSTPRDIRRTARLLGRLYDAIECQGLAPDLVCELSSYAGVPVYDGLGTAAHPTAGLAERIADADSSPAEDRRFVIQAVLLSTVG